MNENTIRKLVKLVEESDVDQLEINSWFKKIRITKRLANSTNGSFGNRAAMQDYIIPQAAPVQTAPAAVESAPAVESKPSDADNNYVKITAPMVGTFYAAPAPDSEPYVREGQKIDVGQVVCIVEAMKLMNEIEAEISGRIVKILAENAQPVEFGQDLYLIDPKG